MKKKISADEQIPIKNPKCHSSQKISRYKLIIFYTDVFKKKELNIISERVTGSKEVPGKCQ